MRNKIYQVDAFTNELFGGNPAAVCPLDRWLPDAVLQKIAMENNLAETAFYVKNNDRFDIRWFTPAVEVDLCGHATLATAFILFNNEGYEGETINFHSVRSGSLSVSKSDDLLTLDFPADQCTTMSLEGLTNGFNIQPTSALKGKTDYVFVYENEKQKIEIEKQKITIKIEILIWAARVPKSKSQNERSTSKSKF